MKRSVTIIVLIITNWGLFGQTFHEIQKVISSDIALQDRFGESVAISQNYAVVGAGLEDHDANGGDQKTDAGSAYIYEKNSSGVWVETQKIVASDRGVVDVFGNAVAISGNYLVVCAENEDEDALGGNTLNGSGSAYVFERNSNGVWVEVQKIVASDRSSLGRFGTSVSISGNEIVVGAMWADRDASGGNFISSAGAAYIFKRDLAGNWNQVQKIVPTDRGADDRFGNAVSISGNYVLVGAYAEDHNQFGGGPFRSFSGSAYIFERNGNGVWNQVQKVVASDRDTGNEFAWTVAISGDYFVVGARSENHDALGNNPFSLAGAAYVFEKDGLGVWNEVQKVVASDRYPGDRFGGAVSMSGDYFIVGAEDQDQDTLSGNVLSQSGSAYVFERNGGGTWNEIQKLVASDRNTLDQFGNSVAIDGKQIVIGSENHNGVLSGSAGAAYIFNSCTSSSSNLSIAVCDSFIVPSGNRVFHTSGTYQDTIRNIEGCDSLITISLTINNSETSSETVSACNSYTWPANGDTYNSSGVYLAPLTNSSGCDSIVSLNLTILQSNTGSETISACDNYTWSASGATYSSSGNYTATLTNAAGCDSVVTLALTINNSEASSETLTACNSYAWAANGNTYSSSGAYQATLSNALGCDSIVTLNLTILNSSTGSESITTCNNYTWPANGLTYSNSGNYQTTLTNAVGCDSVVTLSLTINQSNSGSETMTACDSYTWPTTGITYTTSGNYSTTLTNSVGCDSVVTLALAINNSDASTETTTACNNYSWPANGATYSNSGVYTANLTNAAGCDSVVTLNLTINNNSSSTETISVCDNYTWAASGLTYSSSGTYQTTLSNSLGCDSLLTLNLTVNQSSTGSESISACDNYTWPTNGVTYTSSGSYSTTLMNSAGCDSTATLSLTITSLDTSVTQSGPTLTANETGVAYQWIDCTTMTGIAGETGQAFTPLSTGNYAVVLSQNGCSDTSGCRTVIIVGLTDQELVDESRPALYPNPTTGSFKVDIPKMYSVVKTELLDMHGHLLTKRVSYEGEHLNFKIEQPAGIYFLKIEVDGDPYMLKVIKR